MNVVCWEYYIQVSKDIAVLVKVSFIECCHVASKTYNFTTFHFVSFETFTSIHKISISLRVHNEQRSESKLFTKEFNSLLCPNQLTKVSTLCSRKVNRNVKFDCDKSSLAFSIRLGTVVDQQSTYRYSERKPKIFRVVLEINPIF